jgi:phosphoglycolate phosphatase
MSDSGASEISSGERAVAFDLDGTLVQLDVDIEAVRAQIRELFGAAGERAALRPILTGIDELAEAGSDGDEEKRRELRARARAIIDRAEVAAATRAGLVDGAAKLVAELGRRGVRLGLVTDNGRACATVCLERLRPLSGLWVDAAIVTRDEVERGKPSPEGIAQAARALLPAGGSVWFVGDSVRDVEAARAASTQLDGVTVSSIIVAGGSSSRVRIAAARPDWMIDALGDVLNVIEP